MTKSSQYLINQIKDYLSGYFGNRQYFACIYGSYVNGMKNKDSDIDVLVAIEKYTDDDLKRFKQLIIQLHKENGLKLDNEVPFENKLIIDYADFKKAVNLGAFPRVNDKFTIPKVVKTKKFLTSYQVKLRLAFNSITSPHIFFGNDVKMYGKLKTEAENNLVRLAIDRQSAPSQKKVDLLQVLLFGKNLESGEMYLGYKEYPKVTEHLNKVISRGLKNLGKKDVPGVQKEVGEPKNKIFIGVAWPYVNGNLHVGHVAGYLLPADITARFFRLLGNEVLMVSGSDCFGTPITVEADKKGVSPKEIVNIYHKRNVKLFKNLGLSFDLYTKTDTKNHKEITQDFLKSFWNKGLLEIKKQHQYYSLKSKRFLPDRYVEGTCPNCGFQESRSDQCDNCGSLLDQNLINPVSKIDKSKVVLKETEHLFISWDKLQNKIESYVDSRTGWRSWVKKETKKWLKEGLKPRAVTRDLDWGVKIPKEIAKSLENSKSKRIYVWFDAVIGYYSASLEWAHKNKSDWKEFWYDSGIKHYYFMGKDNLVFHTIFWPGQLMIYDQKLHLPDLPAINQYLNFEGVKFSKSRGVVVDTAEFIEKYGADALRFYLTTIMPEKSDTSFSWKDFLKKNNNLLVGHLGNYIHRTLSLYKGEKIAAKISDQVIDKCEVALANSIDFLKKSRFKNYYLEIESLAKFANVYFNNCRPWDTKKINKNKFKADGPDLIILTYVLACLLEPITPSASKRYLETVGIKENLLWVNEGELKQFLATQLSEIKIDKPRPFYKKFAPTKS